MSPQQPGAGVFASMASAPSVQAAYGMQAPAAQYVQQSAAPVAASAGNQFAVIQEAQGANALAGVTACVRTYTF